MPQLETTQGTQGGLVFQIKHIGTSLLPLALFVGGTLGFDFLTTTPPAQPKHFAKLPVRQANADTPTRSSPPAAQTTVAQPTAPQTSKIAPTKIIPSLRDERSLLDLAVSKAPLSAPALQLHTPGANPALPKQETSLAAATPEATASVPATAPVSQFHLLKLTALPVIAPGTYAVVRGLHQNAQLSHGLPVGDDAWLVDGNDIGRLGVTWQASAPFEPFELDVIVLTGESRVISREKIKVAFDAISKPAVEPAVRVKPQLAEPTIVPAPVPVDSIKLTIAPETALLPGRGSLVHLDLEPSERIPPGAYVILRGLPEGTLVSRGFGMGPDTWLLSITDLKGLEVRLPARTTQPVSLDVRLISADGRMLASDARVITKASDQKPVQLAALPEMSTPPALPAPAAPAQPAARGAVIAPAVRAPEAPAPAPAMPRATVAVPPVAPSAPASPTSMTAEMLSLSRGRKMLETGNIAIARQFLERAASSGSREATVLLASSFDPAWLRRAGVIGIEGDAEVAKRWMLEAQRIENPGASDQQHKPR